MLDVLPGASPGIRRLLVGGGEAGARYSVSVSRAPAFDGVVAHERAMLDHLGGVLPQALRPTLPRAVEWLEGPGSAAALVSTAVRPGVLRGGAASRAPLHPAAVDAVLGWLEALWGGTAGAWAPSQLGRTALEALVGRARDASRLEHLVLPLMDARQRLSAVVVRSAATHGCLCPRHVYADGERVVEVDDWGLGSTGSDPLRDVGRYFVAAARDDLPRVLDGSSPEAGTVREAVGRALEALTVPPSLWRDVLLLAELELAAERSARGDRSGVVLLRRSAEAMPILRQRGDHP